MTRDLVTRDSTSRQSESLTVLITGGAGFIGSNLARRFVSDASVTNVIVLDDLSSGDQANLDGIDVEYVHGSILDRDLLDVLVPRADRVVHLAARPSVPRSIADPAPTHRVNADGTFELLEAIRRAGGRPLVFASSSSVYGANPELPKRVSMAPRPMSPYAASKLAGESYCLSYLHSYSIPVLAFRFFNVYGPFQPAGHAYAAVVPAFMEAALTGRSVSIQGDGLQTRDFTYVGTVVDVLARAAVGAVSHPEPVNLAFGTRTSLLEVLAMIGELMGTPCSAEHVPARRADVRHSQADGSVARELFPDVAPVSLQDGLSETLDWWRRRVG